MFKKLTLFLCAYASTAYAFTGRVNGIVPSLGAWIGFASGDGTPAAWDHEAFVNLGVEPVAHVYFATFPLSKNDKLLLNNQFFTSMSKSHGILILTLEPWGGLDWVLDDDIKELAAVIRKLERVKSFVIIRFAHEMNGSWYPWCQKPALFRKTFQRMANIIKKNTKYATMLWAPSVGTGYPYSDLPYKFNCSKFPEDCDELDTNGDGFITDSDDMYSPFWPGADVVDWVGLSLYWWGKSYPYGLNELPIDNAFSDQLVGQPLFHLPDDPKRLPNFYQMFSVDQDKPFVIAETAAFVNLCDKNKTSPCGTQSNPPTEYSIKSVWWEQAFNLNSGSSRSIADEFPNIKIISWFNNKKVESEAQGNTVDWSVSADPDVLAGFLDHLKQPLEKPGEDPISYWKFGEDFRAHLNISSRNGRKLLHN